MLGNDGQKGNWYRLTVLVGKLTLPNGRPRYHWALPPGLTPRTCVHPVSLALTNIKTFCDCIYIDTHLSNLEVSLPYRFPFRFCLPSELEPAADLRARAAAP